jgi:hypothetical protein
MENNWKKRLCLESIEIFLNWENNVNCRDEINGLNRIYCPLLRNQCHSNTVIEENDT